MNADKATELLIILKNNVNYFIKLACQFNLNIV